MVEKKKNICISLPSELHEKLVENKNMGKSWKINVSRTCRGALEKKLDHIKSLHQSCQALGLKDVDVATIETLKEIIKELEGKKEDEAEEDLW
mgnify:FL=1|tara:strand:+ start:2899 stop:3177 length:279 start_codon:yes stop_codon:yes gene_type:complete